MSKKLKRFFMIFTVCVSIFAVNMTAFAATEYVNGYLRYTVEDGSVTITGYNGREIEVTVPAKIAGVPVNTIASGAFWNANTVKKVNLPDTIMTIEEGAFAVGQTVVYNSNTNETVVTEPNHGVTEDFSKESGDNVQEGAMNDSTKEPSQGTIDGSTTKPNDAVTNEPSDSTPEDASEDSHKESSDKEFSVEEVEVDFSNDFDDSKQETSEKVNSEKVENTEETELSNSDNSDETKTTGTKDTDNKPALIVVILAVVLAGVFIYKFKILENKKK